MQPAPLPLADLTPEHLRSIGLVHAVDPCRPGFHTWVPVPRAGGGATDARDVPVDAARSGEDLSTLGEIIRAAGSLS